ncbi:uncharacterized protein LOC121253610 [Juglans microcarpa x Juglans regia]|uniref:uncharacterized protein LOC121253610 n=1 Tax=Juglans microcarpa x Juglans regia TaxID=2249226 RepID=UPI001B7F2348|nr:uncharacterized protein LOC121253610 [Juglans microcarpa x Juglans regia]
MRKVKARTKKANVNEKCKERDGGDTPSQNTCRNLFGPSEIDLDSEGNVQTIPVNSAFDISGFQNMVESQESMQLGLDGSQPLPKWYGSDFCNIERTSNFNFF